MGDPEDSLGAFVAHHRQRLGLSPNQLAQRTTTFSSAVIRDLETGLQAQLRPRAARALSRALELDPWQTDRFLHLAGCATVIDWQRFAEDILIYLGLGYRFHEESARLYDQSARFPGRVTIPEGDPPP